MLISLFAHSLVYRENDLPTVYRFASPQSQLLSQSYGRFLQMMGNAVYRPLLGHREASLLRSVQMTRDKACVMVGKSCRHVAWA